MTIEQKRAYARAYYHRNVEKCKARHSVWYSQNKELALKKQREHKRQRKLWAIGQLGGMCNKCGGRFHPAVYEFHHTDPTTKDKDPSKLLQLSIARLTEELSKCVLLCANCHRELHHEF